MTYVEVCGYLGAAYESVPEVGDLGIKKDLAKAFKFYKKACGGGYTLGCFGLAGFYLEGKVVEKDNKKALEFFQKACDAGYKEGCTVAATMSGNDADMAKMSAQQKKDRDNNDDMFACGVFAIFMEGKDNKEAAKYYKKACELGKKKSDLVFQKQHSI